MGMLCWTGRLLGGDLLAFDAGGLPGDLMYDGMTTRSNRAPLGKYTKEN